MIFVFILFLAWLIVFLYTQQDPDYTVVRDRARKRWEDNDA